MKRIKDTIKSLMERAHRTHTFRNKPDYEANFIEVPEDVHRELEQFRTNSKEFYSSYALKLHGRADWQGVHPEIRQFVFYFYTHMKKQQIPMYCHTVYRTPIEQEELYKRGFSYLTDGPHMRSCAVNIVHQNRHWECTPAFWSYCGKIGKEIIKAYNLNLEWGGDWKRPYDPAHWQVKDWKNYAPVKPGAKQMRTPIGATFILQEYLDE